jgi:hypothetical protein
MHPKAHCKNHCFTIFSSFLVFFLSLNSTAWSQNGISADTLSVSELSLSTAIVNREPVDQLDEISAEMEQLWCFVRINNPTVEQNISFNWFFEDELYLNHQAKVGVSPRWRTYSYVTPNAGRWRIEIRDATDKLLAEKAFIIK